MKKLLISLTLAAATVFSASADTFEISGASVGWPKMSAYANDYTSTVEFGGTTWTGKGFANNNGGWEYLRVGAKNSENADAYFSSDNPVEYAVEEVCVNVTKFSRGTVNSVSLLIADNNQFTDATIVDFTGDFAKAGEWKATVATPSANKYYKINFNYTNSTKTNGVFETDKITFTYTPGEAPAIAKPEITGAVDVDKYLVTITGEDGADIYYTLDGSEPATQSEKYTAAIDLTSHAGDIVAVKAIAVNGKNTSTVASFNATVPFFFPDFNTILTFAEDKKDAKVVINGTMTVVAQPSTDTRYTYVNCGDRNMLFYQLGRTLNSGDTFNHAEATVAFYGKTIQLTGATLGTVTNGTAIEPKAATLEDVTIDALFSYIKVANVAISDVNAKNGTATDAGGANAKLYNQFGVENFANTAKCNITGIVGKYNNNIQFQPMVIEAYPADPVITPADGETVAADTEVVITAEEGATIYYNTSVDPEFAVYTEGCITVQGNPTDTFTVEAYAEKDGLRSETVTATYTIGGKLNPDIAWVNAEGEPVTEFTWTIGETTFDDMPAFICPPRLFGSITLTSSNPEVAAIDMDADPWLKIITPGTTVLTLSLPETEDYEAGSADLTLIVTDPSQPPSTVSGTFDFTDFNSLNFSTPADAPEAGKGIQIEENSLTANDIVLSFTKTEGTGVRVWNSNGNTTMRIYKSSSMTITAPDNYYVTKVEIPPGSDKGNWDLQMASGEKGTFTDKVWTATADDKVSSVKFEVPAGGTNTYISTITVECTKIPSVPSGVSDMETTDENAPVEYYNLQGLRVLNPENGIYIRRQGSKVTKVII